MKQNLNISTTTIKSALGKLISAINAYRVFLFFLVIAALYGFIIWRINMLAVAGPTEDEVKTAQQQNKSPRVDQSIVQKMTSLKDNSVRVQTLFETARDNPFSE